MLSLLEDPWQPLPDSLVRSALLNAGQGLVKVSTKLVKRLCINILVLGGSVSCGSQAGGYLYSWPHRLVERLNIERPCVNASGDSARHQLWNHCRGGVGSDFWVGKLQEMRFGGGESQVLNETDLVLLDTAINDTCDIASDGQSNARTWHDWHHLGEAKLAYRVQSLTEIIIMLSRSLPSSPDVVYTEMSWTTMFPNYRNTTSDLQNAVCKVHNVPYISSVAALSPRLTAADPAFRVAYKIPKVRAHINDCCHITGAAANLTANIFLRALEGLLANTTTATTATTATTVNPTSSSPNAVVPVRAVFAAQADVDLYLSHEPLILPLLPCSALVANSSSSSSSAAYAPLFTVVSCSGDWVWGRHSTHAHTSFGLQASNHSAAITYRVSPKGLRKYLAKGVLSLSSLHSYEHMGIVRVTVTSLPAPSPSPSPSTPTPKQAPAPAPAVGLTQKPKVLVQREIDCQWQNPISELSTDSIELALTGGYSRAQQFMRPRDDDHNNTSRSPSHSLSPSPSPDADFNFVLDLTIESVVVPERGVTKVKLTRIALW